MIEIKSIFSTSYGDFFECILENNYETSLNNFRNLFEENSSNINFDKINNIFEIALWLSTLNNSQYIDKLKLIIN